MDVVSFVEHMFLEALERKASDIHLEALPGGFCVHFRINGRLFRGSQLFKEESSKVIMHLKVMGNLDISKRHLPQDGHFSLNLRRYKVSLRISTLPTAHGERVALRLLPVNHHWMSWGQLGLFSEQAQQLAHWLMGGGGLLVVTGPTGTGKTTTLYMMLKHLYRKNCNVITLEDPIEQIIAGISQVQINPKAGLTFSVILRAILRQDPDSIMIGEIRDHETADIAIRAALTGHLVLTSLHTVDAVSVVTRLLDMGIAPYKLSAALRGIVAQRLLRKNCVKCHNSDIKCHHCLQSGYQGRIGIFELLPIDEILQQYIIKQASLTLFRQHVKKMGILSLEKILQLKNIRMQTDKTERERVMMSLGAFKA